MIKNMDGVNFIGTMARFTKECGKMVNNMELERLQMRNKKQNMEFGSKVKNPNGLMKTVIILGNKIIMARKIPENFRFWVILNLMSSFN